MDTAAVVAAVAAAARACNMQQQHQHVNEAFSMCWSMRFVLELKGVSV
jgi:hypothetical protein